MVYNTHSATLNVDLLISNGSIDRQHTIINMNYAYGNLFLLFQQEIPSDNNPRREDTHAQLRSIVGEKPELSFSLPKKSKLRWLNNDMIA
ncbi:unnamed protein product [Adineta steineri]|uniref:Uncharacterized protein n=1 Tax=Adineta steineri TaxID=433720 RepID=A0A813NWN0_9BILA|nr:unnamed protein product [Adineta steineri]CAF3798622.1 unnamed protein product [Adineta steineri]